MDVGTHPPDNSDYPAMFCLYVSRGVSAMLRQLRATVPPLSDEMRRQALHILTYALKLNETWSQSRDLLLTLAAPMEQAGYREEWVTYLERGLELSRAQGEHATEADFHFYIGELRQRQSRFGVARSAFDESVARAAQVGDRRRQARALNRLAYLALLERRYEEATHLTRAGRELALGHPEEEAYGYLVEGSIAQRQQLWGSSVDLFQRALRLFEQVENERLIAWTLNNLGMTLRPLERYSDARQAYERAIQLLGAIHDPIHLATARMNLGNLFLTQGQYEAALQQYELAEPDFRKTSDTLRLAALHNNRGICYRHLNEWKLAEQAYRASIHHWRQLDNPISLANVLDGLGLVYLAQDRRDEARALFEEALALLHPRAGDPEAGPLITALREHLARATDD